MFPSLSGTTEKRNGAKKRDLRYELNILELISRESLPSPYFLVRFLV